MALTALRAFYCRSIRRYHRRDQAIGLSSRSDALKPSGFSPRISYLTIAPSRGSDV
ncbi:hypothetical protein SBV1_1600012 [Verrucomicrobia bacterium]|nr:hypothetical protein SBV1_1600012 [Verrucomicrobiota bacterium]